MTTETIAETVTETPAEVSQVAPETAAESTPEVAVAEGPDEELITLLKESGHYGASAETKTVEDSTPSTETAEVLAPEVQAKVDETLAKERQQTAAKTQAELRKSEEDGIRRSFEARVPRLDSYLAERGLSAEERKVVTDEFGYHHGQGARLREMDVAETRQNLAYAYGSQMRDAAQAALSTEGWKLVEAELPKMTGEDATPRFFKQIVAAARQGYLSPAEAEKKADAKVLAFATDLKRKGILPSSQGLTAPTGGTASSGKASYSNKREAANLYAADKISLAEYRNARYDPNLPEGF